MSAASMTFLLSSTLLRVCAATSRCGCSYVHVIGYLQTNGLRDVGACGHGIAIAQKMSIVLGQVVENQRSVQRTVRRDRTTSFLFVLAVWVSTDDEVMTHSDVRGADCEPCPYRIAFMRYTL